ncbi:MAG: SCO family protein, partial [Planctomycetota bacterium]
QGNIDALAKSLGFSYSYDSSNGQYYHPAMLAYVSPEGVIVRYSLDVGFPVNQLKLAILEAGEGKVGTVVEQFVLWCYSYYADKNSYVPQAWKLMRLGGLLTITVVLLASLPYWVGRYRRPTVSGPPDPAGSGG